MGKQQYKFFWDKPMRAYNPKATHPTFTMGIFSVPVKCSLYPSISLGGVDWNWSGNKALPLFFCSNGIVWPGFYFGRNQFKEGLTNRRGISVFLIIDPYINHSIVITDAIINELINFQALIVWLQRSHPSTSDAETFSLFTTWTQSILWHLRHSQLLKSIYNKISAVWFHKQALWESGDPFPLTTVSISFAEMSQDCNSHPECLFRIVIFWNGSMLKIRADMLDTNRWLWFGNTFRTVHVRLKRQRVLWMSVSEAEGSSLYDDLGVERAHDYNSVIFLL